MRARLGACLRRWADRIDDAGAPKRTPFSFTFENVLGGVKLRQDQRGCPLYYVGEADYERAHAESGTAHVAAGGFFLEFRPAGGEPPADGGRPGESRPARRRRADPGE